MRTKTRTTIALAAAAALAFSACGGDDSGADGGTTDGGQAETVTVVAGDLFYTHGGSSTEDGALDIAVTAGDVTLTLDNQGVTEHNIVIEELGADRVVEALGGGQDTGTVTLAAGTYTFFCDIEGHRAAGMEGTFTAG